MPKPSATRSGGRRCHSARFYSGAFPARATAGFLGTGLAAGRAALLLCSAAHADAVLRELHPADRRRVLRRDTGEDGETAVGRVAAALQDLVAEAGPGARIALACEAGAVLHHAGLRDEAVEVEDILGSLCRDHDADVLCLYGVDPGDAGRRGFHRVMVQHDELLTPDGV